MLCNSLWRRGLTIVRGAATAVALLGISVGASQAALLELDRSGFDAAASGLPLFIEDFDGLAAGPLSAPLGLSNGLQFTSPMPFILAAVAALGLLRVRREHSH